MSKKYIIRTRTVKDIGVKIGAQAFNSRDERDAAFSAICDHNSKLQQTGFSLPDGAIEAYCDIANSVEQIQMKLARMVSYENSLSHGFHVILEEVK